jgi:hypothetical protein
MLRSDCDTTTIFLLDIIHSNSPYRPGWELHQDSGISNQSLAVSESAPAFRFSGFPAVIGRPASKA